MYVKSFFQGRSGRSPAIDCSDKSCLWINPTYIYVLLLTLTTVGLARSPVAFAQSIDNPVPQNPPSQPQPELLPPSENLLDNPSNPFNPGTTIPDIPGRWTIQRFEFVGNSAFTDEELTEKIQSFADRPISFAELLQVADLITQLYIDKGYITSGAYIPSQTIGNNVVQIQIVEGSLETTNISNSDRLEGYVRRRLALDDSEPLNINELQQALQLLRLDPLVTNISATLSPSPLPGKNILDVAVDAANPWSARVTLDNNRSPSVSTFRRRADVQYDNLLGFGDSIRVAYTNTDGSDDIEANYRLPINARNGSLSFNFSTTSSDIVEQPFDQLEIDSKSRNYELTLRQPLIQTAKQGSSQEFAVGFTLARRESDTQLFGVGFPLSRGANSDGETRLSVLRFFQDYNHRQTRQVFSARSQFSLGVGWFDATVNSQTPDSRFLAWRGQLLWLRLLGSQNSDLLDKPKLLVRSDIQLAPSNLVALEQFSLGGQASVRGYRQDALLTDNGALASVELQLPVFSTSQIGRVEVIPFIDAGTVWNSSGDQNPDPNFLASVGLGLRWQQGDRFAARLDWGYPLVDIDSRDRTWQENGLYFSLEYNPF